MTVSTTTLAATVAIGLASISTGDFPLPMEQVFAYIRGDASAEAEFIIGTLRLPRVLTGAGVGAAFGMSGAVFQSLVRNPLGSPDIIGFTSGSALGAVVAIVATDGGVARITAGALSGGTLTAAAILLLTWKSGLHVGRLVLIGIGAGLAIAAITDFLLIRAQITDVQLAAVWLTGSLNGSDWTRVQLIAGGVLLMVPLGLIMQRTLDTLALGDDVAGGLGLRVAPAKVALTFGGVALAAVGVAAAGPISFVAFISAPIARRLANTPGASLFPAACVGALITVAADLAARRLLAPIELPVGIMTAILGAPYLLWLLGRPTRTGGP